jgi:hypothetical protein
MEAIQKQREVDANDYYIGRGTFHVEQNLLLQSNDS